MITSDTVPTVSDEPTQTLLIYWIDVYGQIEQLGVLRHIYIGGFYLVVIEKKTPTMVLAFSACMLRHKFKTIVSIFFLLSNDIEQTASTYKHIAFNKALIKTSEPNLRN